MQRLNAPNLLDGQSLGGGIDLSVATPTTSTIYDYRQWLETPTYGSIKTSTGTLVFNDADVTGTFTAVIGSTSPVPLPAAPPMLLAAVGGLGFAARRRKTA
jgi:hypothetical protein